ncbi:hypothetical protein NIES2100_05120 [Calothrix sp. NIES-2100]|uniref:hypothetical protein n=1 Tax=Calothrix sp. NIES-2100 TaxID=1954172 RepID=UPI000B60AB69|nr:hypothetical protein NIES2100_05120 [Calothrix sp. NIES-2100]
MNKSFNKFANLGSIHVRFYWDITRFKNACVTGTTKRQMKRLAAQANRRYIKQITLDEFKDLI